jgi:hypothetical protein
MKKLLGIAFLFNVAFAQTNLYVSATGSDANAGTKSSPFLTLNHARDYVRTLTASQTSDIVVNTIGDLTVNSTLTLTSLDNGKNGFKVRWEDGSWNAGTQITGWTLWNAGKNIYRASYSGKNMSSIWVNGIRCRRSRSGTTLPNSLILDTLGYQGATGTYLATEPNPANVEFIYRIFAFSEGRGIVTSVVGNRVNMLNPCHRIITDVKFGFGQQSDIILKDIENLWGYFYDNATQGTFYYDEAAHYIYYVPRSSESLTTAEVIAPNGLSTMVSMTGVSNVDINTRMQYASWDVRVDGFASISSCWYIPKTYTIAQVVSPDFVGNTAIPSAIYMETCNNCSSSSTIRRCDATGFYRTKGCLNCHANGMTITDMGYNALLLGHASEGATNTMDENCDTKFCLIENIGNLGESACGITHNFPKNCNTENNYFRTIPYCAISSGTGLSSHDSWSAGVSGNTIAYNRIIDAMLKERDGGAIYCQAPQGNLYIVGNWVTGVKNTITGSYPVAAIYMDEGCKDFFIYDNIMEDVEVTGNFNANSAGDNNWYQNYATTSNINNPPVKTGYQAPIVSASPSTAHPEIANIAGLTGVHAKRLITANTTKGMFF